MVGTTHVPLVLDSIAAAKHIERERQGFGFTARGDKDRMRLSISNWWSSEKRGAVMGGASPGMNLPARFRAMLAAEPSAH